MCDKRYVWDDLPAGRPGRRPCSRRPSHATRIGTGSASPIRCWAGVASTWSSSPVGLPRRRHRPV